jgi:hypothetical protein
MAFHYRKPRSKLSRYQWALWLFVLLFLATVGFFWLLGQELRIERVKDRPNKARTKAA